MSEKINCPFCGNIITTDSPRCPSCNSLFEEPELSGIRIKDFRIFFVLHVLTRGLFGILWFLINLKPLNDMVIKPKDRLKLNWLIVFLVFDIIAYFACLGRISLSFITIISFVFLYIIYVGLTYRVLRIIQRYTKKAYNVSLEINENYIVFFNIFYLIHFIDTYNNRVQEIHEHFKMTVPYWIMLIIIFGIAPMVLFTFNPPAYWILIILKELFH